MPEHNLTLKKKTSAAWYVLGVLLILFSPIVGFGTIGYQTYQFIKTVNEFSAPGTNTITVKEPGTYVFVSQTKKDQIKPNKNDIHIQITSNSNGKIIHTSRDLTWQTKLIYNTNHPIAAVNFTQPGTYQVQIKGNITQHPVEIKQVNFWNFISAMLIGGIIIFCGPAVGIALIVIVAIKRSNYKKRQRALATITENTTVENQQDQSNVTATPTTNEQVIEPREKIWAMVCHLSALTGCIIPFGNIVAPLFIWLLLRKQYAYVDEQGRQALNFQLSVTIYFIVSLICILILVGFVLAPLVLLLNFIAIIVAAVETGNAKHFRYPLAIKFFSTESQP